MITPDPPAPHQPILEAPLIAELERLRSALETTLSWCLGCWGTGKVWDTHGADGWRRRPCLICREARALLGAEEESDE